MKRERCREDDQDERQQLLMADEDDPERVVRESILGGDKERDGEGRHIDQKADQGGRRAPVAANPAS